jgi:hypothetical protein
MNGFLWRTGADRKHRHKQRIHVDGAIEVLTKLPANGDPVVAVFNVGEERAAECPLHPDPIARQARCCCTPTPM